MTPLILPLLALALLPQDAPPRDPEAVPVGRVYPLPPRDDDAVAVSGRAIHRHGVHLLLEAYRDYTEEGGTVSVGVFDIGGVDSDHPEFIEDPGTGSRVSFGDESGSWMEQHATAVASLIAARGARAEARGMARRVRIKSFNSLDALDELGKNNYDAILKIKQEATGFLVANFSYITPPAGWVMESERQWTWFGNKAHSRVEDSGFGKYGEGNEALDRILAGAPHLIAVVAAGNYRDPTPPPDGKHAPPRPILEGKEAHYIRDPKDRTKRIASNAMRPPLTANDSGFDTVAGLGLAKNCICVGAVANETPSTSQPGPRDSSFSSWGPADDGRVKPDLVADGEKQYVAWDRNRRREEYMWDRGTSFASPNAAGICALLVEIYSKKYREPPTADLIKAVLVNTAKDEGVRGPDPKNGWGLIDADAAVRLIDTTDGEVLVQQEMTAGGPPYELILGTTGRPIRVTLAWADPPAPANRGGLDDPTSTLVHDLDLELVSPSGRVFWPWRLDPRNPRGPAIQERTDPVDAEGNHVDNVELIEAPYEYGRWTVRVRFPARAGAPGQPAPKQPFALVVGGLKWGVPKPTPAPGESVRITSTVAQQVHRLDRYFQAFNPWTEYGRNVTVALIVGKAWANHPEFRGADGATRVGGRGLVAPDDPRDESQRDMDEYSTSMTGLVAARGENPQAQGVAPLTSVETHPIPDQGVAQSEDLDLLEELRGVQIALHPYRDTGGEPGRYTRRHHTLDRVLTSRESLLAVAPAGNEGDPGPSIATLGLAKNVLCIGSVEAAAAPRPTGLLQAVQEALVPGPRESDYLFAVAPYSSRGPTVDGRIKPDLVALGRGLLASSEEGGQPSYITLNGTGPASSVAAGMATLLVEQFGKDTPSRVPLSDEIRAILIHSARDLDLPGPDIHSGWGVINAYAAGEVIHGENPDRPGVPLHRGKRGAVAEGEVREFHFRRVPDSPTSPVRLTLAWINPAGPEEPAAGATVLQNDLDLELVPPDGKTRHPYSLDPAHLDCPARTDRPNRVDNVERIDVEDAAEGDWIVRVRGTRLRVLDAGRIEHGPDGRLRQGFALIWSGLITAD